MLNKRKGKMGKTEFVLTAATKRILASRGKVLVCYICGKPLKIDQKLHTNAKRLRYYHKTCFEKLLH